MKLIVNRCFGGYSLSPLAVKELAKRKGKKCFFFKTEDYLNGKYIPITLDQAKEQLLWHAFTVPNPNEVISDQSKWHEMSLKERKLSNESYKKYSLDTRPEDRADLDLVYVVEKLGVKANGSHANLKVVEIPDGVDWEIDEYDGQESIHEKHRSW